MSDSDELVKRVRALRACFDDRTQEINRCIVKIEAIADRLVEEKPQIKVKPIPR